MAAQRLRRPETAGAGACRMTTMRLLRIVTLAALAFAPVAVTIAAVQEHPRAAHRHDDAQALQNPIARSPESAGAGAKVYGKLCVTCHGPNGLGNGRLAAGMAAYGARPSDLTDGEWQHGSSDGEIFTVIRDGVGPDFHMPAYQGKLSDTEIWNLVNHIRVLGS
jgi:mono/diheme cytochrome c family protein